MVIVIPESRKTIRERRGSNRTSQADGLRVSAGSDILDPDGDDVTATKLAVDSQVEHGEVASAAFDLKFRRDRPDVFGAQRGFAPVTLPLFQGTRLWGAGIAFT